MAGARSNRESRRSSPSSIPSSRCETLRTRRVSRSRSAADGRLSAPMANSWARTARSRVSNAADSAELTTRFSSNSWASLPMASSPCLVTLSFRLCSSLIGLHCIARRRPNRRGLPAGTLRLDRARIGPTRPSFSTQAGNRTRFELFRLASDTKGYERYCRAPHLQTDCAFPGCGRSACDVWLLPGASPGSALQSSERTSSVLDTSSLDWSVRGPRYSIDHVQENATIAE